MEAVLDEEPGFHHTLDEPRLLEAKELSEDEVDVRTQDIHWQEVHGTHLKRLVFTSNRNQRAENVAKSIVL